MRTVCHHVGGTLAVVALLGLRREATLFGMMVQTTTVITAAGRDNLNQQSFDISPSCLDGANNVSVCRVYSTVQQS